MFRICSECLECISQRTWKRFALSFNWTSVEHFDVFMLKLFLQLHRIGNWLFHPKARKWTTANGNRRQRFSLNYDGDGEDKNDNLSDLVVRWSRDYVTLLTIVDKLKQSNHELGDSGTEQHSQFLFGYFLVCCERLTAENSIHQDLRLYLICSKSNLSSAVNMIEIEMHPQAFFSEFHSGDRWGPA